MRQHEFQLNTLGSKEAGVNILNKMLSSSIAYQKFIKHKNIHPNNLVEWDRIPILNKKNFYAAYPRHEIMPPELKTDVYTIVRSSGESNADGVSRGFYWLRLKSNEIAFSAVECQQTIKILNLLNKKTLFIVGVSLGSWSAGRTSFTMSSIAMLPNVNMTVLSSGNQPTEILEAITKFQADYDQIFIANCPSAIAYFELTAKELEIDIPWKKISYVVAGEPFSEDERLRRHRAYQHNSKDLTMISVYGAADTGSLGYESLPLIKLRQFLTLNPSIAQKLGFKQKLIPNMYHALTEGCYLEKIDGELIVTKWQGLPLVRYNLEDRIEMISWQGICNAIAELPDQDVKSWHKLSMLALPDILAVYGRSKGCLYLTGANIYETVIKEVAHQSKIFNKISNGTFLVWKTTENTEALHWQIELKSGQAHPTAEEINQLYFELIHNMGKLQEDFYEDYENIYQHYTGTKSQIFKLHFCEHSHLSQHPAFSQRIKTKIIIENGPI
ncbi:phenylacetate--CoA ligase family protein [soil metagenome]